MELYYENRQYKDLEGEIFKDIPNYEGLYQASNLGRIKSLKTKIVLKQKLSNQGYLRTTLCKNKNKRCIGTHRLVALCFIPNPDNLPVVNHKDENKINNCAYNLEWCTIQYNNTYGHRIEKMLPHLIKKIVQLDVEGNYIRTWENISKVGRQFEINAAVIIGCCSGTYKTACGYKWMYEDDYNKINKLDTIKYKFQNKPFIQTTMSGKFIKEWYSLNQMYKELGYNKSSISQCLNGIRNKSHNCKWIYASDYYSNFNDLDKEYSNAIGYEHLMEIASTRKIMQ